MHLPLCPPHHKSLISHWICRLDLACADVSQRLHGFSSQPAFSGIPHQCSDLERKHTDFPFSIAVEVGSCTQCEFVLFPPTFTCFPSGRLAAELQMAPLGSGRAVTDISSGQMDPTIYSEHRLGWSCTTSRQPSQHALRHPNGMGRYTCRNLKTCNKGDFSALFRKMTSAKLVNYEAFFGSPDMMWISDLYRRSSGSHHHC